MIGAHEPHPSGCPACRDRQQRLAALEAEVQRLRAALGGQTAAAPAPPRGFQPVRRDGPHPLAGPHRACREQPSAQTGQPGTSAIVVPPESAEQTPPPPSAESQPAPEPLPTNYNGTISGVVFTPLVRWGDARGWLMELFRQDELAAVHHPQMGYVSETRPGVVRGPHEHVEQTDLFVFAGPGKFRLYLWDARAGSPTHGRYVVVELGEHCPCAVLVPPGVVHAYKNIGAGPGWVFNLPNRLYRGEGRRQAVDEIRHEDRPDSPYRVA